MFSETLYSIECIVCIQYYTRLNVHMHKEESCTVWVLNLAYIVVGICNYYMYFGGGGGGLGVKPTKYLSKMVHS